MALVIHFSFTGISDVDDCSLRNNAVEKLNAPSESAIFRIFHNVSGGR